MRRLLSLEALGAALALACATPGDSPAAGAQAPDAGEAAETAPGPVFFEGPFHPGGVNPELRLPPATAEALGIMAPTFAMPSDVDKLEAMCRESRFPERCLRALRVCRERTCRLVPALR